MKQIVGLPQPVMDNILAYLAERPWKEVAQLIGAVQTNLVRVEVAEKKTTRHPPKPPADGIPA